MKKPLRIMRYVLVDDKGNRVPGGVHESRHAAIEAASAAAGSYAVEEITFKEVKSELVYLPFVKAEVWPPKGKGK